MKKLISIFVALLFAAFATHGVKPNIVVILADLLPSPLAPKPAGPERRGRTGWASQKLLNRARGHQERNLRDRIRSTLLI